MRLKLMVTALAVLALAGCQAPQKSPEEMLNGSAAKMAAQKGYHFTMHMTMSMDTTAAGGKAMTIPLDGEGDAVLPDRVRMSMEMKAPIAVKIETIVIGGTSYTKNPMDGRWQKTSGAAGSPMALSPTDSAALLTAATGKVEDRGSETVGGVASRHLAFSLDEQAMKRLLAQVQQASTTPVSVDRMEAWIGESDGLPRRISLDATVDLGAALGAAGAVAGGGPSPVMKASLKMEMEMSDFGKVVDIQAPADAVDASSPAATR